MAGVANLVAVDHPGAPTPSLTVPPGSAPTGRLRVATVTPDTGLQPGQMVAVHWSGFDPGAKVNVVECSRNPPSGPGDCDLGHARLFLDDPTGTGSTSFTVQTGTVGGGRCGSGDPPCVVVVNQGGSTAPQDSAVVTLAFGPGAPG